MNRERTPSKCFECVHFDKAWVRCKLPSCIKEVFDNKIKLEMI